MATQRRPRRGFGKIARMRSGRFQASYVGPDLIRHTAPDTFHTRGDADAWLLSERQLLNTPDWTPPKERARARWKGSTLADYAPLALDRRRVRGRPLKPRTRALYDSLLERVILPDLGDRPMRSISADIVIRWYDHLDPEKPTQRAHAYGVLHTIMSEALAQRLISENPCTIRGAAKVERAGRTEIATPDELVKIAAGMPGRLQLLVMLAGWCGLRFGELAELRRKDLDLERATVNVSRAVVRVDGKDVVDSPKSAAGKRVVAIPPHLIPMIEEHLSTYVLDAPDSLVFNRRSGPNRHLIHTEVTKSFRRAREAAGRPDLRLHDLRHTAAVMAAQTGATLAELMARLGHSTPQAALRYQHAAQGRDAQIAQALSQMATPTTKKKRKKSKGKK